MGNELLLMLDGEEDSMQLSSVTAAAGWSAAVTSVMMASLLLVLSPLLPVDEHDSDDNLRLTMSVLLQLQS